MAHHPRKIRQKREQEMRYCNCIVAIFQVMVACQSITFISGQGYLFPSTEHQSQKILQGVSLFPRQQAQGVTSERNDKKPYSVSHSTSQIRIIRFEPPFLDFDTECVGMPKLRTVYIHNPGKERDLQLSSISARTSHFHSSFFERKIVPPGGNTSFEVVFLARVIGNVENTLFINTIHGTFPYQVFGSGIPNPYRLRPYLGAKVAINSSFSPLISMHNPTSEPLQVTEMYSSSGYLQLQLPSGEHDVDKDKWEIPPYETKQVMQARFLGQVEANHTAFIRIKTAQTESSEYHILPVEVEVSSAPGIYSSTELLDFGTVRTQYDDPKTLPLFLLNSGSREVVISSITLSTPNPAISIDFKSVKLKPSESTFTRVANITFSALLAKTEAQQKGSLTVKTKEKSYPTVEIPFTIDLLDGTLAYDEGTTLFHQLDVKSESKIVREISLENMFPFPVILQNVSLTYEANHFFKILDFSGPVTLPSYTQMSPFTVQYTQPDGQGKQYDVLPNDAAGSIYYLILQTNASKFSLPLHTYSGVISYKVLREDTKKIDFGIMGTMDQRQVLFALYNRNPTPVTLDVMNSTLSNINIKLVSLTQGWDKNLTEEANFRLENFELPSNSCSVFEVTLSASETEEEIFGAINMHTKYQEIRIPLLARVVVGALTVKPEKIKLSPSFPGLIVNQAVTIINTFAQTTTLDSVHFKHGDKRFYYKKIKNQSANLDPNKKVKIGKVYFDARQSCKPDRCYVGLPTSTTVWHHWMSTLALGPDSVEVDTKLYKDFRQRWANLQNKGHKRINTTLMLETNVVMGVEVPVQATLYWPTLLEESTFHFPLTHVGRKSVAVLALLNPADSPVIVQVLPLSLYPQPETALEAFGWSNLTQDQSFITSNTSVFHLLDPRYDSGKDSMTSHMVWLEYTLNGKLNHSVVNLFLDPGQRVTLKVEFIPYDDQPKSTVILLRNNLTILDALVMHGRGVYEHLTLGGKSPNLSNSVLRFKIKKDILKDCTRTTKKPNPSFTVRKWFHANNTGMLPIHVTSVTVNGSPCEGYGFRVLDCDQFILQPNSSKKLEIAFTPDFTSFLILHQLKLVTAQGNEMIFILNVTLPPYMLPLCQEAVPRPSWEPALYHFIALVMVVLFIGILLMSYLEAINIWEPFVRLYEVELQQREDAVGNGLNKKGQRQEAPEGFGKRFDLRNIATSFISTVTSTQQPKSDTNKRKKPTPSNSNGTFTALTLVGYSPGVRQDTSQQTDPHPDYPPLTKSFFSSCSRGFLSAFTKTRVSKPCIESDINPEKCKDSAVSPNNTSVRQRTTLTQNKLKENTIKIVAAPNMVNSNGAQILSEVPPEFTADIQHYARMLANFNPCQDGEKAKEMGNSIQNEQKTSTDKKVQQGIKPNAEKIEKGTKINTTLETAKRNATEKRKSRSKANQQTRVSTSSSTSNDLPDTEISEAKQEIKEKAADNSIYEKDKVSTKVEKELKQDLGVRGKKLRKTKLSRKQMKAAALAKEKEDAAALGKNVHETSEKEKASTPSEEEKSLLDSGKETNKKSTKSKRASKLRSLSTSAEQPTQITDKTTVTSADTKSPIGKKMEKKSPETNQNCVPEIKRPSSPKRRSNSYSHDNSKGWEKGSKVKQYTIYRNPRASDSRSSSSQEISESSSSESPPLWDTPSKNRDPNEEMMQLSKQTQQADFLMDVKKTQKDKKRMKGGAASPEHLTSSSRSSSYSSMVSSASSNEGNFVKQQTNGGMNTPSKKLSRSVSDATSGNATKPILRKRNPYSSVSKEGSSPTHRSFTPNKETQFIPQNMGRNSPKTPPGPAPTLRALSSPSMFNMFGKTKQQNPEPKPAAIQDIAQPNWSYNNPPLTSSYSAFGQSSFNFMESFIGSSTSAQDSILSPSWGSPFSDNSSLYSTPSPQKTEVNISPHHTNNMAIRPRNWSNSGSPLHAPKTYFDAPPGTPTTPGVHQGPGNGPLGWGDIPSPTSSNMSTHSIWSVSNAVTMDENRNADECDLLGLKSIWSNASNIRNPDWHDRR